MNKRTLDRLFKEREAIEELCEKVEGIVVGAAEQLILELLGSAKKKKVGARVVYSRLRSINKNLGDGDIYVALHRLCQIGKVSEVYGDHSCARAYELAEKD